MIQGIHHNAFWLRDVIKCSYVDMLSVFMCVCVYPSYSWIILSSNCQDLLRVGEETDFK